MRNEVIFSVPGSAWYRTALEALPLLRRGTGTALRRVRQAEPARQCVPRGSLGTRRLFLPIAKAKAARNSVQFELNRVNAKLTCHGIDNLASAGAFGVNHLL